jgi:hypothetical protein
VDYDDLEVVRNKRFTLKPMDVEEAILQMNMVGHNFLRVLQHRHCGSERRLQTR